MQNIEDLIIPFETTLDIFIETVIIIFPIFTIIMLLPLCYYVLKILFTPTWPTNSTSKWPTNSTSKWPTNSTSKWPTNSTKKVVTESVYKPEKEAIQKIWPSDLTLEEFTEGYTKILKTEPEPLNKKNSFPFYCQTCQQDKNRFISRYQCQNCKRFVCTTCFTKMKQAEFDNCPMCEGEMKKC